MTSHRTPTHRCFRKGGALITTIILMLVLGVLGVSIIAMTSSSRHTYASANATSRAHYLAESGLRYAQEIWRNQGWLHGRERTMTLASGEQVDLIRVENYFWATSVVDVGTAMEARARVPMAIATTDDFSFDGVESPGLVSSPVSLDDFAIFGDTATALGQDIEIDGDVALVKEALDIKADIQGNILAGDVKVNGQGSILSLDGGIYSSGTVEFQSATLAGDINAAAGISIVSAEATVEGWLFSDGPVELGGGATVLGHIHACGGDVELGGSSAVGTADNPVEIRTTGNVYLSSSTPVYGTIYAGGNIIFSGSAQVIGDAYAGDTISDANVTGVAMENSPSYLEDPICAYLDLLDGLELPPATEFTTGGSRVSVPQIRQNQSDTFALAEGTYGALSANNNSSGNLAGLVLSAGTTDHARYYFDSISLAKDNKLYLNLEGTKDIRIFVTGDVTIAAIEIYISTDGVNYVSAADPNIDTAAAARVYIESHGDFDLSSNAVFYGSVYTPYGTLNVGNTSVLYGSFYSGGGHSTIGSTITHIPPNYYDDRD